MSSKISSHILTTCRIAEEGDSIMLEFFDQKGTPVALEFPFEQAESIAMTLPRLLSDALKTQTGDEAARYVFPLGKWRFESAEGSNNLILTLSTPDGFQVAFAVPRDTAAALGWSLSKEGKKGIDSAKEAQLIDATSQAQLN